MSKPPRNAERKQGLYVWFEGRASTPGFLAAWRKENPFKNVAVEFQDRALEVALRVAQRVLKKFNRHVAPELTEAQVKVIVDQILKFGRKSARIPKEQHDMHELVEDGRVKELVQDIQRL